MSLLDQGLDLTDPPGLDPLDAKLLEVAVDLQAHREEASGARNASPPMGRAASRWMS